jgi:hypothetical protein
MRAVVLVALLVGPLVLSGCAESVRMTYGDDFWKTESQAYAAPYRYAYVYPYPRRYYRPFTRPWRGGYRGPYRNLSPYRPGPPRLAPAPVPRPPTSIPPQFRKMQ